MSVAGAPVARRRPWARCLVAAALVAGCDDGGAVATDASVSADLAPPADVAGLDATPRTDLSLADAAPMDARPADAAPLDARLPDADAPDGETPDGDAEPADLGTDLAPRDAAPPDATPVDAAPPDAAPPLELCENGEDDDGDGQIDCADADCGPEPNCAPGPAYTEGELEARCTTDCSRCHPFLIDEFLSRTHNRQVVGLPIITPGDHRRSYLWYKLAGTLSRIDGLGQTMPIGAPWPAGDVARFALWVNGLPPLN